MCMSSACVCASASASHRVLCGRCVGVLVYVRGPQSLTEASTPGLVSSNGRVSRAFLQGLALQLVPATRRGVAGSRPVWKQNGDTRCCLWPWVRLLAACPRQRASGILVRGPAPSPELSWPCPAAFGGLLFSFSFDLLVPERVTQATCLLDFSQPF